MWIGGEERVLYEGVGLGAGAPADYAGDRKVRLAY